MEKYEIFKTYLHDSLSDIHITENLMRNTRDGWAVYYIGKNIIIYHKLVDKETREKYYRQVAKKVDSLNHTFID